MVYSFGHVDTIPSATGTIFSVVCIPDTGDSYSVPGYFGTIAQWIVNNQVVQNIQAVLHLGDVVANAAVPAQWAWADASIDLLDTAEIPYLIGLGNHDYTTSATRTATDYNTTFPQARYTAHAWWNGGFYEAGHSENSYMILSIGGVNYLFINLEVGPRANVMAWADALLTTHADKSTIIATHSYLYRTGARVHTGDEYDPEASWADAHNGEHMWQEYLKTHDNIIWIHSGHDITGQVGGNYRRDNSDGGQSVCQVLSNYQDFPPNNGEGFIRVIQFNPTARTYTCYAYSMTRRRRIWNAYNEFDGVY